MTAVERYVRDFERVRAAAGPDWLRAMREDAFGRFEALGFPTTRDEEWRFTNVSPIAEREFRLAGPAAEGVPAPHLAPYRFDAESIEIAFVNGRLAPALCRLGRLPDGVAVGSLAEAIAADPDRIGSHLARHAAFERQPFAALNTAFALDGAFVEIGPNVVVGRPIHVLFVAAGAGEISHPRVLVLAGPNSQLHLVESYVAHPAGIRERGAGDAPAFTNAVTEIAAGDGAVVDHYRVQREAGAFHLSTLHARLSRGSAYSSHTFTFGGAIVRNDVYALLAGEGADCTLNGLYLAGGQGLIDNHTVIDHAEPHCGSHEVYKGVLDGRARAVFNGKIRVRPAAQKTDAKQTNKTLLLSDDAQINTKPQLEIFANDVKCTHGATVGQLSADALFYLQARGIDRAAARRMLIRAFAGDITARVKIGALREYLDRVLRETLARGSHAADATNSPAEAGSHRRLNNPAEAGSHKRGGDNSERPDDGEAGTGEVREVEAEA